MEFERRFASEEACRAYLVRLRWPDGARCLRCQGTKVWPTGRGLYHCAACGFQTSVLAGTIFQDTKQDLQLWFRAMWYVTNQKSGVSALGLQRALGLGSYRTAWTWLHKLRAAMVRPGRCISLKAILSHAQPILGRLGAGRGPAAPAAQEPQRPSARPPDTARITAESSVPSGRAVEGSR